MTLIRDLRRLVEVAPARFVDAGWPANCCVAATRIAVDVLRACGHPARPLSVVMAIEHPDGRITRLGSPGGGRILPTGDWAGHLTTVVDGYLVDLTAGQVPGLRPLVAAYPVRVDEGYSLDQGAHTITYRPLGHDASYAAAMDWRLDGPGPVRDLRDALVADLAGTAAV